MNCPFCNTHEDKHSAGYCADAWLAKSMGWTVSVSEDKPLPNYATDLTGAIRTFDMTSFEQFNPTVDLNVFMTEVMPKLHEVFEDIEIGYDAERDKWVFYDGAWGVIGEGKTINEALFRAAVKVLSK